MFLSVVSPVYGLAGSLFTVFAVAVMLRSGWLVMLGGELHRGTIDLVPANPSRT